MSWSQSVIVVWGQFALASLLLMGLASLLLRRIEQPAERLVLIFGSLIAGVTLPILLAVGGLSTWRWEVIEPVATVARGETSDRTESPVALLAGSHNERSSRTAPHGVSEWPSSLSTGVEHEKDELRLSNSSVAAPHVDHAASTTAMDNGLQRQSIWQIAALFLLSVLLSFAGLFLVRRQRGVNQWKKIWGQASRAPAELQQAWNAVTGTRGGAVELRVSNACTSPLLRGWFHPQVLVPADIVAQGGYALRSCLAHEWAHIIRRDFAGWRFADCCQLLFWFAPGYWALRRELRTCQDILADRAATVETGDALEYSELLVALAKRGCVDVTGSALAFSERRSQLLRRVQLLLDPSVAVVGRSRQGFKCVVAVLTAFMVLLASSVRIDAMASSTTNMVDDGATATVQQSSPKPAPSLTATQHSPMVKPTAGASATQGAAHYRCRVVEQGSGRPIAGALVTVRRSLTDGGAHRLLLETKHKSDADGYYELEISAEHGAESSLYVELDVEHPDYPPKKGFGYSYTMIRKNEKLGERPFFESMELRLGEPVTGTVLDPQGQPLVDMKVGGVSMPAGDFNNISWNDTRTDAQGRFRLVMQKDAEAVIWFLPKSHAIVEKYLARRRGDLGEFKLSAGTRLRGIVLGVDGKPVAGMPVNLMFQGEREASNLPVLSGIRRGALSNETGEFELDPLPPGEYQLSINDSLNDPLDDNRKQHQLSAVFAPQRVVLKDNEATARALLQAVPHVFVNAQYYDSSGRKTRGHAFHLHGQLDGQFWNAEGRPDTNGTVALRVPHGLTDTTMQLMTNEHGALRYRRSAKEELRDDVMLIKLGTLNDDIAELQIIRYAAPVVLVSAVDEQGRPVGKLRVAANYTKPRPAQYISFADGSDVGFEWQNGDVYRSSQMLPDEELTLKVSADGFESASEKVTLAEGVKRELRLTLKKALPVAPPTDSPK